MARKTKQDWLKEGLHILADQGATALKLDTLSARLGVTKGSFYHHFDNFHAFKTSLLDWVEQAGTLRIIEMTEQGGTPLEKFDRLLHATSDEPAGTEVAVRAWALQDKVACAYQARIDAQRLAYVEALCLEFAIAPVQAHIMAQMLYAMYVGCGQMLPPIAGKEMIRLFDAFRDAFQISDNKE